MQNDRETLLSTGFDVDPARVDCQLTLLFPRSSIRVGCLISDLSSLHIGVTNMLFYSLSFVFSLARFVGRRLDGRDGVTHDRRVVTCILSA